MRLHRYFLILFSAAAVGSCLVAATASAAEAITISPDATELNVAANLEEVVNCALGDDLRDPQHLPRDCAFVAAPSRQAMQFAEHRLWWRFTLDNPGNAPTPLVLNNDIVVKDMVLIDAAQIQAPLYAGVAHADEQNINPITPGMRFVARPGRSTYFVGISSGRHPFSLSLRLRTAPAYAQAETARLTSLAGLFGALIALLVYNVLLTVTNYSKLSLHYTIGLAAITLLQLLLNGVHALLGERLGLLIAWTWPASLGLAYSAFTWFAAEYYGINRSSRLALRLLQINSFGAVAFAGLYFVRPKELSPFFAFTALLAVAVLSGMTLQRLRNRRRVDAYFLFANSPLVGGTALVFLMGLGLIAFDRRYLDLACGCIVVQQLLLSLVGGSNARRQLVERTKIQASIELGRSVQDLLLPARLTGSSDRFEFLFVYRPFENLMSGDWIHSWTTSDGASHFIVGDVVGKGPQAALAVAAIVTTIKSSVVADHGVAAALIAIDAMLRDVFTGHVTSVYSATTISATCEARLYNGGGRGWYLFSKDAVAHHLPRGQILGAMADATLASVVVPLADGAVLLTCTDGICDTPMDGRRLANLVSTLLAGGTEIADVAGQIIALKPGEQVNDDQTMLIIKRQSAAADPAAILASFPTTKRKGLKGTA